MQMINEEKAVPSKQDFIILVMVDSFHAMVLCKSYPPVTGFILLMVSITLVKVVIEKLM